MDKSNQALKAVHQYVNNELYNPFSCEVLVKRKDGNLVFDCGVWVITMGIEDDWFNVSTKKGCGIGEYDLDQIVDIRDNKETIIELYCGGRNNILNIK